MFELMSQNVSPSWGQTPTINAPGGKDIIDTDVKLNLAAFVYFVLGVWLLPVIFVYILHYLIQRPLRAYPECRTFFTTAYVCLFLPYYLMLITCLSAYGGYAFFVVSSIISTTHDGSLIIAVLGWMITMVGIIDYHKKKCQEIFDNLTKDDNPEIFWKSIFDNTHLLGQHYIDNQLLNKEYLAEMPLAVITGLPQLTLLQCVERTLSYDDAHQENKLVLDLPPSNNKPPLNNSSSPVAVSEGTPLLFLTRNTKAATTSALNVKTEVLILTDRNRPKNEDFVGDVWNKMMEIKSIYHEYLVLCEEDDQNECTKPTERTDIVSIDLSIDEGSDDDVGLSIEEGSESNDSDDDEEKLVRMTKHKEYLNCVEEKALFHAIILSAGEAFDDLPVEFQTFFEAHGISKAMDFGTEFFNQSTRRHKLHLVWNLLNEIVLKVSREQQFKDFLLSKVIEPLTSE